MSTWLDTFRLSYQVSESWQTQHPNAHWHVPRLENRANQNGSLITIPQSFQSDARVQKDRPWSRPPTHQRTTPKSATVSIRGAQIAILASWSSAHARALWLRHTTRSASSRACFKRHSNSYLYTRGRHRTASCWEANMNVRLRFGRPRCADGVPPSPALNASVRVGLPGKRSSVTAYLGPVNDRTFSVY